MSSVEAYIADVRALVRWWVVGFAAMASTAIGGLSLFRADTLRPWAEVTWLLLLITGFVVATAVLLGVARVFRLPKDWSELPAADQAGSAAFGAGPDQLAVWDRSTTDRARAEEVRQRVLSAVRQRECGAALRDVIRRLWLAAGIVLLLVVSLVVVRELGRAPADDCRTTVDSCPSPLITAPTQVRVRLMPGADGRATQARQLLARRLGGARCSPPASFDAVATGGRLTRPVLVGELSGCAGAEFILDHDEGVAIPFLPAAGVPGTR